MLLAKFVSVFRRKRPAVPAELSELRSADQLRETLTRERSRADRSGIGFTLLVFIPREAATCRETLVCLVRILKRRLRCTDEIGWLDEQQIAAILPCTTVEGAQNLAEEICSGFGDLAPPRCEMYRYPSDSAGDSPDDRGDAAAQSDSDLPVGALEPLFAQPMSLAKRTLDVLGAVTALTLLAPVMLLIAVAIKLTSRGPVMFKQWRAGLGNEPFLMYKFRTMKVGAEQLRDQLLDSNEQDGPAFKIKNDPRINTLGRFLRSTSLDELPQLWNVIKGEMSLVGPRPLPCDESRGCCDWQRWRLDVTPGLTCIWQVEGRSTVSFDHWMRMDLRYIRKKSFVHDMKLILLTMPAVALRKGAR